MATAYQSTCLAFSDQGLEGVTAGIPVVVHSPDMTPDQWFAFGSQAIEVLSPALAALLAEITRATAEARRESQKKGRPDDDEPEADRE